MKPARLSATHLTKRFGAGDTEVAAVRDVGLEVAPGEIVLIMGPSGSGKTTLLLMLGALLRPTGGTVRLDDQALTGLDERRLPDIRLHRVGFIFQDFNLLSALSAAENVALVAGLTGLGRRQARARAEDLLRVLGLGERLDFLPEKMSGGEKQRVAIARALINDPTLILADEPTANLDSKSGHDTMVLLQRVARENQLSVVIVSHDQRIRDIADRVLWLEDGEFKELSGMVIDPVCQMAVERETAASGQLRGQTYYFCSRGCRAEFLSATEEVLGAESAP
jgi:putative ABC transport system ATP-binding protein